MIHSSCTLLGFRSSVSRGMARCRTVRSIEYSRHGSAMTANPIHSRLPALGPFTHAPRFTLASLELESGEDLSQIDRDLGSRYAPANRIAHDAAPRACRAH